MQIHSVQHTGTGRSVENHCPHGKSGACSECNPMGGGGGGGGGVKRNTSGLMNWNQAWALWSSLQLASARQKEYLKGMEANQFRLQQEGMIQQPNRLIMALARFIQTPTMQTIAQSLNTVVRSFSQFANSVQSGMRALIQTGLQGLERINIADKLATILGESKKLFNDILQYNIDVLKDLMSRLKFFEQLAQVNHLMEKMLKTLVSEATQWIQETAERVQHVLEQLKRWFKKTPQNSKQKRQK